MKEKPEIKNIYNLTPLQEGMLYHYLLEPHATTYIEQMEFNAEGNICLEAIEKSFNTLIERHDSLRTVFYYKNVDKPLQVVLKNRKASVTIRDVSSLDLKEAEKYAEEFKTMDVKKGFDLSKDLLMRLTLIKTAANCYKIIWTHHHIIIDGWCLSIIISEFFSIYYSVVSNQSIRLEPAMPYSDYIMWLNKQDKEKAKRYWEKYLFGYESKAVIPFSRKEGYADYFPGEYCLIFDKETTEKITGFSAENQTTTNTVFQSIWGILLQKYGNTDDVVFGSVVSGRPVNLAGADMMVGLFINTVPVRVKCDANLPFCELLKRMNDETLESREFDYLPLTTVQAGLGSKIKLIDHIMIFENYPIQKKVGENTKALGFSINNISLFSRTNYDFNIVVLPGDQIVVKFCCNKSVCDINFVKRISEHFKQALLAVISKPDIKIMDIEILTKEEKTLLHQFNHTSADNGSTKTIHELFMERAKENPDKIAVVYGDKSLTYRELNEKSNQLARKLINLGVTQNAIVGIMAERSLEIIIGIFGVLKAGCAYLPIDVDYPVERVKYMLDNSGAKILLKKGMIHQDIAFSGEVLELDEPGSYCKDTLNPDNIVESDDLAYLIYTSGSTGNPKGVMISHRAVINFLHGITDNIAFSPEKTMLSLTTISFDIFVLETLIPLTKGLKTVIASKEEQNDPKAFKNAVLRENINMIQTTPSRIQLFLQDYEAAECMAQLTDIMIGGEPFPKNLYPVLTRYTKAKIYNMYGPTETTVWSTMDEIKDGSVITIGRPIRNTQIYILDRNNKLQPIGVSGELCIAGYGLAEGYYNDQKLTAEKFIINPIKKGERLYKTGDIAKWLDDGRIECQGRLDDQVKIRGYRIETGEIEAQIMKCAEVGKAVVIAKTDPHGSKYLCAYLVGGSRLNIADLKKSLAQMLPDYMIPSYFVEVDDIPVLPNGKINRKALPAPEDIVKGKQQYVSPQDEYEEKVLSMMKNILNINDMGVTDNFYELGGHSLNTVMLSSRIYKEFRVEVPIKEIYQNPTARELAGLIRLKNRKDSQEITPAEKRDYYPLTASQKRLFILNGMEETGLQYNLPFAVLIDGRLDVHRLKDAIEKLTQRHEALRTEFHIADDGPVQKILEYVEVPFRHIKADEEQLNSIIMENITPFNLNNAPLFKFILIEINSSRFALFFDIHHIIADGMSIHILINDLFALYRGEVLPPLSLQYKDFSVWQQSLMKSEKLLKQAEYWTGKLQDELPVLNLITDYPRPAIQQYCGDTLSLTLEEELVLKLQDICKKQDISMYTFLLAAYSILLHIYTGQEDIIIGTPMAGRACVEMGGVIGMFVNTIAIRTFPKAKSALVDYFHEVKTSIIEGMQNQDYPFEDLVDKSNVRRDLSRNPIFDTLFVMQNYGLPQVNCEDFSVTPYPFDNPTSKFDITLEAIEYNKSILLNFEYCTALFSGKTIERFACHFRSLLMDMSEKIKADMCISHVDIMSETERDMILNSFSKPVEDTFNEDTLHGLFKKAADRFRSQTALIYNESRMTYEELNKASNRVGRYLRKKGVRPDDIIGIMMKRSSDMIIGILGILKSGGAYMPVDPDFPEERKQYLIEDSGMRIMLTHQKCDFKTDSNIEIICIDSSDVCHEDDTDLPFISSPDDLAYVLYTSGSTGYPKGVMIEHRSAVNVLMDLQKKYPLGSQDSWLFKTSYTFDVSVTEIFGWFSGGGRLVILENGFEKDPEYILETIHQYHITHINFVPSMLSFFARTVKQNERYKMNTLKYLFSAGEEIPADLVNELMNLSSQISYVNLYGPTEAAVYTTGYDLKPMENSANIPIGKPLSNICVYIMNRYNELCPIGVPGELCISGVGVARGYLNKPELTKEKFVPDPFNSGKVMYKTGDIARWLPDGNIEYLGRVDHQIKIRGYRIEIGEIEAQLKKHELIDDAVVTVKDTPAGDKALCAYIIHKDGLTLSQIREYLMKKLPSYMVPAHFARLESFPLSQSGKINRNMLPNPEGEPIREKNYVPPGNPVEEQIAKVWSKVLNVETVGITDNFFELGGDSLKALRITSEMEKYNIFIRVHDILGYQTIQSIYNQVLSRTEAGRLTPATDLVNGIMKRFNLKSRLVEEADQYCSYYTLYIESSDEYSDESIIEFIRNEFDSESQPHYIRRYNAGEELPQIASQNDSQVRERQEICTMLEKEAERLIDVFNESIINRGIKATHELSMTQKMFLDESFAYSGFQIHINRFISVETLEKAIVRVIEANSSLRSTIAKIRDSMVRIEYNMPNLAPIPIIDISQYDGRSKNEIIENLFAKLSFKEYKLGSALLYRIVIIRENLKKYRIIMPFHHAVFDEMSGEVIERQLMKSCEDIEKGITVNDTGEEYEDYCLQIRKGPQRITEERIIERFRLYDFKENTMHVSDTLQKYSHQETEEHILRIVLEDIDKLTDINKMWEMTVWLTTTLCTGFFGITRIPVTLFSYGRKYEGRTYFNSVGNFLDMIPVIVDTNAEIAEEITNIGEKLNIAATHNINFVALLFDQELQQRYQQINKLLAPNLDSLIMLNYHGLVTEKAVETADYYSNGYRRLFAGKKNNKPPVGGILFDVMYTRRMLRISIDGPRGLFDKDSGNMIKDKISLLNNGVDSNDQLKYSKKKEPVCLNCQSYD